MSDRFDVIVVGGGAAAGVAAARLARAGHSVFVLDSAPELQGPGGLWWPAEVEAVPSELRGALPPGVAVGEHHWVVAQEQAYLSAEYRAESESGTHSTLRSHLDRQVGRAFLEHAKAAGAVVKKSAVPVRLAQEGGRTVGVRAGSDEVRAPISLLADPAADPAQDGAASPLRGWSQYIPLEPERVRERFGLSRGKGLAMEAVLGFMPVPGCAVGVLQTHESGVSLGVLALNGKTPPEVGSLLRVLTELRAHPAVAGFISGGEPEGPGVPLDPFPLRRPPSEAGALRIGSAGGFGVASGPLVTGPGFAVRTAVLAAACVEAAFRKPESIATAPRRFEAGLRASGILQALSRQRERALRVAFNPRLHHKYPPFFLDLFHRIMTESGAPKEPATVTARRARAASGVRLWDLVADGATTGLSL